MEPQSVPDGSKIAYPCEGPDPEHTWTERLAAEGWSYLMCWYCGETADLVDQ